MLTHDEIAAGAAALKAATKFYEIIIEPAVKKGVIKLRSLNAPKFKEKTIDYIERLNKQCTYVNTIAFQNAPKKLIDLYVPITISTQINSIKVTEDKNIFENHGHILLVDKAGMGKSTLSKRIILNAIEQGTHFPILIEPRKLRSPDIRKHIKDLLGIEEELPEKINEKIKLLYVFDGIDEISADIKSESIYEIKRFLEERGASNVLMTSRHESYLSEFYTCENFSIEALDEQEAYRLIEKYDRHGDVSKNLIEALQRTNHSIKEFLATPLYVSLLYCAYRYKTKIPQKKHLFYAQVYDALYEAHDLSKEVSYVREKYSNLNSTDFHSVLRRFAFSCLKNEGKIEFQKDEIGIEISKIIKGMSEIQCGADEFIKDIVETVPLFVKDGATIRWSHKSLMEYFAAMFICHDAKEAQKNILEKLYASEDSFSYKNILELCADIDYSTFRSTLEKKILEECIKHHEESYKLITNKKIKKSLIDERKKLTFASELNFLVLESLDGEMKFNNILNRFRIKENSIVLFTSYPVANGRIAIILCSEQPPKMILDIIAERSPDIVRKTKYYTAMLPEKATPVELSKIKLNEVYNIDDAPENPVNSAKNFGAINEFIKACYPDELSLEAAKRELNLINQDESNGISKLIEGF